MKAKTPSNPADVASLAKLRQDAVAANIKILETFYSFLVGFAITQATIKVAGALLAPTPDTSRIGDLILYAALLVTIVPFYQGMNRYLYDIHIVEPFEGTARRIPPLLLDIYAFVAMSILIFVMGQYISDPEAFFYTWSLLLIVDIVWTFTVWAIRRSKNPLWAWNNLVWLVLAWLYWLALHNTSTLQLGLGATSEQLIYGFVAFEMLRTVGDYYINWQFYFPPKPIAAKVASPDIIYLAGPYSNDGPARPGDKASAAKRLARFHAITEAARRLIEGGHIVYSPLTMTHPIDVRMKKDPGGPFWVAFDEAFMAHCNRMIIVELPGWEDSSGIKHEVKYFEGRGIHHERRSPAEFGIEKETAEFAAAFA